MGRQVGSRTVYVIGVTDAPIKIGIADRVHRRLAELQTGCPDILVIHHQFKVPWDLAEKIERAAHGELDDRRRHGEWFNVHKDEAAEIIERHKAKFLQDRRATASSRGDLIEILKADYELHWRARDAVCNYLDRADAKDAEYISHANGYVLKSSGMAAYAAFSLVIAQRKRLSGLKGSELHKAKSALARAINALAEFDHRYLSLKQDFVHLREGWLPLGGELAKIRAGKAA